MKDLSIIIPHYNSVNSLIKLLSTIPKKENIQIIVIDDKSNEQIIEYMNVRESEDFNHVLFLNNDTNKKGAGVCRNIGLQHTKGTWVLFADADDYFLESFYDNISDYLDSKYDVVFFTPTSRETNTDKLSDRHINYAKLIDEYIKGADQRSEIRLRYRFFVPWSKLIKYDFIKKNNIFFDEVIASNDVMFSTRIGYYMKEFKVLPTVIYCVTRGYGTLTTNINPKIYEARVNVFIKNYVFLKNKLKKKDFKTLHLHGLGVMFNAYRNKLGLKKVIQVFILLKRNNVTIFDKRLLNPKFIFRRYKQFRGERKYLLNR